MKNLLMISAMVGLLSCGNNESGTNGADTAATGHEAQDTAAAAAASHPSMMQMMQANMDQMKAIQSTGNPDNDFAALMKVHHMGALEMAQAEVDRGTDTELQAMARKMIDDQQREIAELNNFLSGHSAHGGGEGFHKQAMDQMNNMKMEMDHTGSIDKQFAEMMILHHQGAIDMSRAYLKSGGHEAKIKAMANNIISAQQKEIQELKAWLDKHK